ncbi:MAG TPA: ribosomal protein S18-alanine N-acetyltransferase [Sphingomicrobium sp.]|nr:ribosomal protein S18-alanine N-acetyltransferase [Sphingomicrobium sp.]
MATRRHNASTVQLRSGGVDDLDEVMRIMTAAFPPCFGEAWTRSQCAGIMPMHGVTMTIAESGGIPVGFSLVRAVADEAELLLLAVDPKEQRRGIGQALLDEFIASALVRGAHRLHLEVRDGNPAIELYRASGFSPAGRRRNYYHGPGGEAYDAVTLLLTD